MSTGMSLEGMRAPQGLDAEDRLAFGLTASHLSYLLVGSLAGYALLASHLPAVVKYPLGVLCVAAGVLLAWGRLAHRPLDAWAWLALRYYLRPRRSPGPPGEPAVEILESTADEPPSDHAGPLLTGGGEHEPPPVATPTTEEDPGPEPRVLTLPARIPHVIGGKGEYQVDSSPGQLQGSAPVFLAPTQRVAFFSLKGGVGKTTLATEVATLLARSGRYRGHPDAAPLPLRVALLDVDLGSANVSMKVGLTHPTMWDLVLDPQPDRARVEECLVTHHDSGLRVLLGPPRAIAAGETRALAMQRLAQVLMHLDEDGYHFVFLDLSSDVDELTTYALEASHHVYYVMTPTASGVQDTYRGVETLRRLGHRRKLRFVLNQSRGDFNPQEMLADLGGTLAATIPRDDAFMAAEDEHRPACLNDGSPASKSIAELAASIYPNLEGGARRAGWWQRLRGRLG
jgi:MinD-like ATPase involved in chromosome partitioning or flagellar assembly